MVTVPAAAPEPAEAVPRRAARRRPRADGFEAEIGELESRSAAPSARGRVAGRAMPASSPG